MRNTALPPLEGVDGMCSFANGLSHLVDVGNQPSFPRCVNFLIVGSHFTLDGEEQDFEIPLLRESKREIKYFS